MVACALAENPIGVTHTGGALRAAYKASSAARSAGSAPLRNAASASLLRMPAMTGSAAGAAASVCDGAGVTGGAALAGLGDGTAGFGDGVAAPVGVAGCSAVATSSATQATGTSTAYTRARPPATLTATKDRPCMCVSPEPQKVSPRSEQPPLRPAARPKRQS